MENFLRSRKAKAVAVGVAELVLSMVTFLKLSDQGGHKFKPLWICQLISICEKLDLISKPQILGT
jgi:hypothetical protein